MDSWVILLRGINVGGHGKLPMADLRYIVTAKGAQNVQTYIQSGNVTLQGPRPDTAALADEIEARHGFRRPIMVLSADEFGAIMRACPFEPAEGKHLHVFFTGPLDAPDLSAPLALAADDEQLFAGPNAVYLHAPGGIGRSKLAETLPNHLPPETTARNWNTVLKLAEMLALGNSAAP
tara:strand:- start:577 stop:1110 length:534 start_codon:yes stop_codon:yes gene_type:complete